MVILGAFEGIAHPQEGAFEYCANLIEKNLGVDRFAFEGSDGFAELLRICRFGQMRIKTSIKCALLVTLVSPACESNDARGVFERHL